MPKVVDPIEVEKEEAKQAKKAAKEKAMDAEMAKEVAALLDDSCVSSL